MDWKLTLTKCESSTKTTGTLTLHNKTLLQWLTYQRLHAKALSERQIQLLDSIRYKETSGFRECDEEEWESKFTELKHLGSGQKKGAALSSWVSRQKRKGFEDKLAPEKRRRLEEIGIDFSVYKAYLKQKEKSIDMARWNKQFTKLKEFRRIHGHCMVPKRYEDDPSMGAWLSNQRQRYRKRQQQELSLDDHWIQRLEELGIAWSCKPKTSTLRSKSGKASTKASAAMHP
jgi:hypothetical protein